MQIPLVIRSLCFGQVNETYHHVIHLGHIACMPPLAYQLLHHIGDNELDQLPPLIDVYSGQLGGQAFIILNDEQNDSEFIRDQLHMKGFEGLLIGHRSIYSTLQQAA
ncbi:hypothetical protein D3C73_1390670 [compost metagenome]